MLASDHENVVKCTLKCILLKYSFSKSSKSNKNIILLLEVLIEKMS